MRVLLRALRWLLVGGLLLLVAAAAATQTAAFRDFLRDRIVAAVNAGVRGEIAIGAIEGTLLTHLTLRDLEVRDDGEVIVAVPRLSLELAPAALLAGRVMISRVEVEAPVVRAREDAEGDWNLVRAFEAVEPAPPATAVESEAAALPVAIVLPALVLERGTVEIALHGEPPATYEIGSLELRGAASLGPAGIEVALSRLDAVLRAADLPPVEVSAGLSYAETGGPSVLVVERLEAAAGSSRLALVARAEDLDRPRLEARLAIERIAAVDLAALVEGLPLAEDIAGEVEVSGTLDELLTEVRLAIGDGSLTARATADVAAEEPHFDLQAKAAGFDLARLAPGLEVAGVAEASVRLAARGREIDGVTAAAELALRDLVAAERRVGDVTATANLETGALAVRATVAGAGRAEVHARVALAAESYELAARVDALELAAVAGDQAPLEAKINLDARITGRGFSPDDMEASATVDLRPSGIGPLRVDGGRIAARVAGERVDVDELRLEAAGASVRVSGDLGIGAEQSGRLSYEARVPDLAPWLELAGQEGGGRLDLAGRASGGLGDLRTEGTLALARVAVAGRSLGRGELRFEAAGLGGARPTAEANLALAEVDAGVELKSVSARLGLAGEEPARARLDLEVTTADDRPQRLVAEVTLGDEEVDVRVEEISLDAPGGAWRLVNPARIRRRVDGVRVGGLRLENRGQSIAVDGGLAEKGGEVLEVRVAGVELDVANAFAPEGVTAIAGTLDADLRLAGTLAAPAPSGAIELRGGGVTLGPIGVAVTDIALVVRADPARIEVARLSARAGEGGLDAGGSVALAGLEPQSLDLRLELDRWPAVRTRQVEATVSGRIDATGPVSGPEIRGRIDVVRADVRPELSMLTAGGGPPPRDPTIVVVQEREEAAANGEVGGAASDAADALRDLTLDLRVAIERDAWIRHPMLGLELAGAIDARKRPRRDLALTGRIGVVRGWLYFQGRRFTPTKGEVVFTGGDPADPSLDIALQTRVADYTIEAAVGGTAVEPSLELSSEPRLEEADILSLLMFGKPINNLDQGEQTALQQQAQNMAANLAVGQVGQAMSDALGLGIDIQEIDVAAGRIGLGKYLTPQTYVSVAQDFAGRGGQQVTVDYYVTPQWTLRTSADSTGNNGADVFWRLEY